MVKRAPARRRPRKAKPGTKGLLPGESRLERVEGSAADALAAVEKAGGSVVGMYKEPLGGHPVLLAVLPIDAIEPTPFQRDLSDTHHKRLTDVIAKTGRYLDPVIAVVAPSQGFWTPNGHHRLAAMRRLGARSITALIVVDREVAWQILALNTEKAHNLKERSLEVIRIYRGLVEEDAARPESDFAFYLEEAALVTLGVCYEQATRFGGGVYHSILRRLENFSNDQLRASLKIHEKHAATVLDLEERVAAVVKKLKDRGLVSPYLRSFVVARINPLRWIKGDPPPLEDVLKTMREGAAKFNVEKIRTQDLAGAAGPPDEYENPEHAIRSVELFIAGAALGTFLFAALGGAAQSTPQRSLLAPSKRNHTLAIVNPATLQVIARTPVGPDPHEVIGSSDGRMAYVSIYGGGRYHALSVIDLIAQKALPDIDTGALNGPHGLAFVGGKVWFTAEGAKACRVSGPSFLTRDQRK